MGLFLAVIQLARCSDEERLLHLNCSVGKGSADGLAGSLKNQGSGPGYVGLEQDSGKWA